MYEFELLSGLTFDCPNRRLVDAAANVVSTVPAPAYEQSDAALADALNGVLKMAALRPDRMEEILAQVTLPYPFYAMVLNLQPGRHRFTYEVMAAVWRMSTVIVMQFKHCFGIARPADRSALIQPVLLTPGHGSYPAGHATQSNFVTYVLKKLLGNAVTNDLADQLDRLTLRIPENRVVAGLHYDEDNEAGAGLGTDLGAYFYAKCSNPGNVPPAQYTALQWLWANAGLEWS
jgi:hypothetical protein